MNLSGFFLVVILLILSHLHAYIKTMASIFWSEVMLHSQHLTCSTIYSENYKLFSSLEYQVGAYLEESS